MRYQFIAEEIVTIEELRRLIEAEFILNIPLTFIKENIVAYLYVSYDQFMGKSCVYLI